MYKKRRKRERVRNAGKEKYLEGRLSVTASGFGFVTSDDSDKDIFIPPKYLGSAIDGDLVRISLLKEKSRRFQSKGPAGAVDKIIERKRNTIVGELIAGHRVRPLSKRLPNDIRVNGSLMNAKHGDWVEVALLPYNRKGGEQIQGTLNQVLGKAGTVESDLNAIIQEYSLPGLYSDEEEREALQIPQMDIPREDLTQLFCVTIDPVDAKDYDDAISISPGKNENETELGVHIADIASWIETDSKWDINAAERAFTAYLPGKTMPMLPKGLTRAISLSPQKTSLCNTVMITVDTAAGKILNSRRCHSLIKIAARLNFDEVQEFIDGTTPENWDTELMDNMRRLLDLTRKMRNFRRDDEKFLDLATTGIRVLCDDATKEILGLKEEIQTESDQLVEECMLAANVEVAKELISKRIPGIFRVHPEPDPAKIAEFTVFMEEVFGLAPGDLSNRAACNHFLSNLADDHKKPVIIDAFLRSLMRAYYCEKPALHFGLGKGLYCHFTSPIRRYPDMVVHQQLWASDFAGEPGLHGKKRSKEEIFSIAAECSEKEVVNDEAYYAANDRLKLYYLKQQMFKAELGCQEGIIRKLSNAGLLVDIPDLGLIGFVPVEYLGGHFRKRSGKLFPIRGHAGYKCGDFIYLQLERLDFIRGSAVFRPVR